MKKQILNLGKALNKAEQKLVNGGKVLHGGYQCCNAYGSCGKCVTGSSEDCSSYGEGVYGQHC
jgi:endonuclease III